jgi:hypothetical protein
LGSEVRALIARLRDRRRASIGWKLKHDNPRHLTRQQYERELVSCDAALARAMHDEDAPGPLGVLRARAEQMRRWHQGPPPLTVEQQVAALRREAIAASASGDSRRRRVVY